jgi:hypothetical protein
MKYIPGSVQEYDICQLEESNTSLTSLCLNVYTLQSQQTQFQTEVFCLLVLSLLEWYQALVNCYASFCQPQSCGTLAAGILSSNWMFRGYRLLWIHLIKRNDFSNSDKFVLEEGLVLSSPAYNSIHYPGCSQSGVAYWIEHLSSHPLEYLYSSLMTQNAINTVCSDLETQRPGPY